MYILGIMSGHNATAALLKDGKIISCISEERLNRKKNYLGFPEKSIKALIDNENITIKQIDKVIIVGKDARGHEISLFNPNKFNVGYRTIPKTFKEKKIYQLRKVIYKNKSLYFLKKRIEEKKYEKLKKKNKEDKILNEYSNRININKDKIEFIDHHYAHAISTLFLNEKNEKCLIFTLDGEGDDISATVNIFDGNKLETISKTPKEYSLGWFYGRVTQFLNMKANEHEFKVMGLAPYAKEEYIKKPYELMKDKIYLSKDGLAFESEFVMSYSDIFFDEEMQLVRFDNFAGAAQKLTEELIIQWITNAVKRTGIKNVYLSGGVFMNVKANMRIAQLPIINKVIVMPSAADESLAIGACYHGFKYTKNKNSKIKILPLKDLYLGLNYHNDYIKNMIKRDKLEKKYNIIKYDNIEVEIAKLLSEGKVVARFKGRSEWGARALGNRSILADPRNFDTIRIINEQIKGRDFWMPFTPSIIEEDKDKYIINPKNIEAPYMAITFDSTDIGREHLKAAIHMYDFTVRPQIVNKIWNNDYYNMIKEFKKLTGVGAVLNTSFNLHGEPNVETPEDAIHTIKNSGLLYLAIENYMFIKKE